MSKALYIVDAADSWALADDTPEVRTMLDEVDDLWEVCTPPITINEVEL
jgi:hypothetical protein